MAATCYGYDRLPRTQNERRQYDPEFTRPCRNPTHLPHSWDEIPRNNWRDRSWKNRYKKAKQWMRKRCKRTWLDLCMPDDFVVDKYSGLSATSCDLERLEMRARNQNKRRKPYWVSCYPYEKGRLRVDEFTYQEGWQSPG